MPRDRQRALNFNLPVSPKIDALKFDYSGFQEPSAVMTVGEFSGLRIYDFAFPIAIGKGPRPIRLRGIRRSPARARRIASR
jgi:hypothetical protein